MLEELTYLYQRDRTTGLLISSHGLAGPLKCKTAADFRISSGDLKDRDPSPATCHDGSRDCVSPLKASRVGGKAPGCHNCSPELTLCNQIKICVTKLKCRYHEEK